MSVIPYWKGRLDAGRPVYEDAYWVEGYDWKPHEPMLGTWPKLIAKQALWNDYLAWFEDVYLESFRQSPYFKEFPDNLPKPAREHEFWGAIAPFLYVSGKARLQSRGYFVWGKRMHLGEMVPARVHRSFIRLGSHPEHVAQYELLTGAGSVPHAEAMDVVSEAMRRMHTQHLVNKSRLPDALRKD